MNVSCAFPQPASCPLGCHERLRLRLALRSGWSSTAAASASATGEPLTTGLADLALAGEADLDLQRARASERDLLRADLAQPSGLSKGWCALAVQTLPRPAQNQPPTRQLSASQQARGGVLQVRQGTMREVQASLQQRQQLDAQLKGLLKASQVASQSTGSLCAPRAGRSRAW